MVFIRAEILADTVFKRFRLADVDDGIITAVHDVHARVKRQLHRLFAQLFDMRHFFFRKLYHAHLHAAQSLSD